MPHMTKKSALRQRKGPWTLQNPPRHHYISSNITQTPPLSFLKNAPLQVCYKKTQHNQLSCQQHRDSKVSKRQHYTLLLKVLIPLPCIQYQIQNQMQSYFNFWQQSILNHENIDDIFHIMKFSVGQLLPRTLKEISLFKPNQYKIRFPSQGNLTGLARQG